MVVPPWRTAWKLRPREGHLHDSQALLQHPYQPQLAAMAGFEGHQGTRWQGPGCHLNHGSCVLLGPESYL